MRARPIPRWEQEQVDADEAAEQAWKRYHSRHQRVIRWLRRNVVEFFPALGWAQALWILVLSGLISIGHRDVTVGVLLAICALSYEYRIFRTTRRLLKRILLLRDEADRARRASSTLAGALQAQTEFLVEQKMHYEGMELGPGVWMDGEWHPVDDEHEQAGR